MGDHYIGAEILLPRVDKIARAMQWHVVMMPREMLWAGLVQIQYLILGCIKLSEVTELSLLSQWMPSAMQIGMSIFS